jgi:hypothetical protein
MSLTEEDKVRARIHMGYVNVTEVATFVLGIPAALQTQYMIEEGFLKILPSAVTRFRQYLDRLDRLEAQIDENSENVEASAVGDIRLRPDAFKEVIMRYKFWQGSLGNMMGVIANPFDMRPFLGGGYGGNSMVNVSMSG